MGTLTMELSSVDDATGTSSSTCTSKVSCSPPSHTTSCDSLEQALMMASSGSCCPSVPNRSSSISSSSQSVPNRSSSSSSSSPSVPYRGTTGSSTSPSVVHVSSPQGRLACEERGELCGITVRYHCGIIVEEECGGGGAVVEEG